MNRGTARTGTCRCLTDGTCADDARWAASMALAFGIVARNPYQSFSQKASVSSSLMSLTN